MHRCVRSFLGRGWGLCLRLILLSLHNRVILYLEPLKGDYHTGQLEQLLSTKGVHWSSVHFCHFVCLQLQGHGVSSFLQCPFLDSTWGCSSSSDILESWSPQPNNLGIFQALGAQSARGGISRLSTCFSRSWRGDGSLSSSMYIICSSGVFSWWTPVTASWSFLFCPSGRGKMRAGNFSVMGRWTF